MPIPVAKELWLPVLRVLGDGTEHSSKELQEQMKAQFKGGPDELLRKHQNGTGVFVNNVALALANLQGAPHGGSRVITKVKEEVYKINERGQAILRRNPSHLSIYDL
jgi:Mrr restriction endonuclease-like protein